MTVHDIVLHPHPVLNRIAEPVLDFSPSVKILANDLLHTLKAHGGIGLSAPQIDHSVRIMVTHLEGDGEQIYINPTILSKSAVGFVRESCLSLPGIAGNVWRATKIQVRAQDINGLCFEQSLSGMGAVCMQHEIDHLDGILFIERFSKLKKLTMKISAGVQERFQGVESKTTR